MIRLAIISLIGVVVLRFRHRPRIEHFPIRADTVEAFMRRLKERDD